MTELDSLFEIRAKTAYSATSLGCSRLPSTIGPMLGVQKKDPRQGPGDRLSDPLVGTCLVPTAEAILGIRLLHTPCEKREAAEGMVEGGALDIEGNTDTTSLSSPHDVETRRLPRTSRSCQDTALIFEL
jgi:hypothetical protein